MSRSEEVPSLEAKEKEIDEKYNKLKNGKTGLESDCGAKSLSEKEKSLCKEKKQKWFKQQKLEEVKQKDQKILDKINELKNQVTELDDQLQLAKNKSRCKHKENGIEKFDIRIKNFDSLSNVEEAVEKFNKIKYTLPDDEQTQDLANIDTCLGGGRRSRRHFKKIRRTRKPRVKSIWRSLYFW
jgi:DNA repair exonuclease SbcCD ATPase subunit